MKNYKVILIIIIVFATLWLWFNKSKIYYNNSNEKQLQHTIDSLNVEISHNHEQIKQLDSVKQELDFQILQDKKQLTISSKKAEEYRKKYEKELTIIGNMSNDDIIAIFTATFN